MNRIVELLLQRRGIGDVEKFLHPSIADLVPPETLPGIADAAETVLAAIAARRPIVVFGDYDCDGVCATAIMMTTLGALGAHCEAFLPKRLEEGYGMSDASVARMLVKHPDTGLVISVDNGINSVEQVATLKARGISVVITDHHLPGEQLPAADAIMNPKVAAPPELCNICGAAVAFLLANHLISLARARGLYEGDNIGGPLLVLAGLATVTDIMPVLGLNRVLVAEAINHFGSWSPIGLRELYRRASRTGYGDMSSRDFGFILGPRMNAAGRLSSGMEALELVTTCDREIARECARIVDGYNVERKAIEQQMNDEAMSKIVVGAAAQVIDLPHGHPGVAGIVAARIMEKLNNTQPVCVLASGHGSARAPEGFNIRDAFVACDAVLERYGGHAAAGGFSVREGKVDEFRRLLCEYTAAHPCAKPGAREPDLWIETEDVTLELVDALHSLEPYGEGNREPVFGFRAATLGNVTLLGHEKRHLCLEVNGIKAIWWGHSELAESLKGSPATYDVQFTVKANDYGERHVELRLQSLAEANSQDGRVGVPSPTAAGDGRVGVPSPTVPEIVKES